MEVDVAVIVETPQVEKRALGAGRVVRRAWVLDEHVEHGQGIGQAWMTHHRTLVLRGASRTKVGREVVAIGAGIRGRHEIPDHLPRNSRTGGNYPAPDAIARHSIPMLAVIKHRY